MPPQGLPGQPHYHGLLWLRFNPLGFVAGFPFIVGAICGWFVARRLHRDQQTAAVLLFAGSILLVDLLLYAPFISTVGPYVGYSVFMPLLADVAASLLGILLGGGLLGDKPITVKH